MKAQGAKQLRRLLQSQYLFPTKGRGSIQLRKNQNDKRSGIVILDPKKIKSRLSQLFKQQNQIKRAQSCFHKQQRSNKKNLQQFFSKSFLKKKQRGQSHHIIRRSKMQIINDEQSKQIEPLFNIKEIKIKRKGSPYDFATQKKVEQTFSDRYYRVLSFAKTRFNQKIYRKPLVPQAAKVYQSKLPSNNFLKTKTKFKLSQQQRAQHYPIEPWSKQQDLQQQQYQEI